MDSPVAFTIFNRPDTTARVFDAIRSARPKTLLVVADGPRENRPGEAEQCRAARAVIDRVDWPCKVLRNFSDVNLGCGARMSSGITWVFEQVERAIILEDDCLPSRSFFTYCDELLERYADDERVMMISGANLVGTWKARQQSYHFCYYYDAIWGWACWRRAWRHYDFRIPRWADPQVKQGIRERLQNEDQYVFRSKTMDQAFAGQIDTWDYQWSFTRLSRGGLTVAPSRNLVSNLGFGADATHTTDMSHGMSNLPVHELTFPLRHPAIVKPDRDFDATYFKLWQYRRPTERSLVRRAVSRMRRMLFSTIKSTGCS